MKLNVGCGPHYAAGWINLDLVRNEEANIVPDMIASLADLPFADGSIQRLYAGHCLEHIPIIGSPSLFDLAMAEVRRVLDPDSGMACFVCPDVYKAIHWFKDGRAPWSLVDACLEGPDDGIDPASAWDGCFHAFNCHSSRLEGLVSKTFANAIAIPMESPALNEFPVVSRAAWQCAVVTGPLS